MFPRVQIVALAATLLMPGFNLAHAAEVTRETVVAPESPQLERSLRTGRDRRSQPPERRRTDDADGSVLNHAAKDVLRAPRG